MIAKPTGAACNLSCRYCFFLTKEALYPGSRFRMSEETLEVYVRQLIASQAGPEITFAWQGGEPTLMGLPFFRRCVELQRQYARPGTTITNTMQTNGVLLDDEWGAFLAEHRVLVGLSLDGPRAMHDAYRVDRGGKGTHARVEGAARLLRAHGVEFNILTTVHAANADHPVEVYRYLRDEVGARFLQFIPIVERTTPGTAARADVGWAADPKAPRALYQQRGTATTRRSVRPEQWGRFLIRLFDEWSSHDIASVYVQLFDVALGVWLGLPASLCIFAETCGLAVAMEHTGDVYACDHYVEPDYRLGNIAEASLSALVGSDRQRAFGAAKRDRLPACCRECDVLFICRGECPRNRFARTPTGEPGLNYLCAGYKAFFRHIDPAMRLMVAEVQAGRPPRNVMAYLRQRHELGAQPDRSVGRNDPCPCGSGRRYKHCHGR